MNQVFQDPALQHRYETDGYVTLPLLSSAEVRFLQQEYDRLEHHEPRGFHCSMFHPDSDHRRKVDTLIKETVGDKLDNVLINHRKLFANFVVKEPGQESDLYVHQDWTFVDETKYASLALWMPLVDTVKENGALFLVPGSHRIGNKVRGPGAPDPFSTLHQQIRDKYGKVIPMKAGEAILWHHQMIHYSLPNYSNTTRVAPTIIMIPKEAQAFYHWAETVDGKVNTEVERFKIDTEFYMALNVHTRPDRAESLSWVDCTYPPLDERQLSILLDRSEDENVGFLNRLQRFFRADKKPMNT